MVGSQRVEDLVLNRPRCWCASAASTQTCPQTRRRRVPLPHQTDSIGAEMHYSLHGDVTFLGACHNVQVCEIG